MYCSSCGASVAPNLTYCNHCGAKLREVKGENVIKSSEVKPELLVSAMAAVFILGLVAIAVLIGVMRQVAGFDLPFLIAATLLSFALMLLVEGTFIRLLLRRKNVEKEVSDTTRLNEHALKELYTAPAQALTDSMPSVIEQTTNLLEPIHRDQKSK